MVHQTPPIAVNLFFQLPKLQRAKRYQTNWILWCKDIIPSLWRKPPRKWLLHPFGSKWRGKKLLKWTKRNCWNYLAFFFIMKEFLVKRLNFVIKKNFEKKEVIQQVIFTGKQSAEVNLYDRKGSHPSSLRRDNGPQPVFPHCPNLTMFQVKLTLDKWVSAPRDIHYLNLGKDSPILLGRSRIL